MKRWIGRAVSTQQRGSLSLHLGHSRVVDHHGMVERSTSVLVRHSAWHCRVGTTTLAHARKEDSRNLEAVGFDGLGQPTSAVVQPRVRVAPVLQVRADAHFSPLSACHDELVWVEDRVLVQGGCRGG